MLVKVAPDQAASYVYLKIYVYPRICFNKSNNGTQMMLCIRYYRAQVVVIAIHFDSYPW